MTRGRAATTDPFDISAVSRSDELLDALAARRLAESDDPAAALLAALVTDVDKDAPPLPAPTRVACASPRRRGVRAIVTFGVAAVVLTSAGAAAAGGNNTVGAMDTPHGPGKQGSTERSNENVRHQQPSVGLLYAVHRSPSHRRGGDPDAEATRPAKDRSARRAARKMDKTDKTDQDDKTNGPNQVTWGPVDPPLIPSPTTPAEPRSAPGVRKPLPQSDPQPEGS